jgi:hypothetical protein
MMANWPTLPPPNQGLEEEHYRPQLKTEFEANYGQSRPKVTRSVNRWPNLGWGYLLEADYQTLAAFFDANQGSVFSWTHPVTSVTHQCRFSADSLRSRLAIPGYREGVQCPLEEV